MEKAEKRIKADRILHETQLTSEQKLFVISQIYKDEIFKEYPNLHYAILAWKDNILNRLKTPTTTQYLEEFGIWESENL